MTVSSLREAARQEAERIFYDWLEQYRGDDNVYVPAYSAFREGFEAGAAWAEQEAASARERDLEQALTNICEYRAGCRVTGPGH